MSTPSIAQLQRAIQIQEQIGKLKIDLNSVLSGGQSTEGVSTGNGKQTETQPATKAVKPVKKKRNMSPAARARIVAAQKKRWAAFKKAKK